MVLESIIGEANVRRHPVLIFLITFLVSVGGIIAAYQVFESYASVLATAFITIGLVPIIHNIFAKEQYDEIMHRKSAATFFARHFNVILIYVWIFIGVVFAFALVYSVSPPELRTTIFSEQINAFCSISNSANCTNGVPNSIVANFGASAFDSCQNPGVSDVFSCSLYVFENNIRVLIFVLILSLLYGAGAIFIIVWNASILGIFFGELFLMEAHIIWVGFLQSMLIGHGPPELLGYIFAALAGTLLSAMISRGTFLKSELFIILKDVAFLTFLAFFSILYGAIVEAIGILGLVDLHFILGFVYVLVIIVAVAVYGREKTVR